MITNYTYSKTFMAALISLLLSGAAAAADNSFYVPKPGEVFSYKDITPEIWDATEQNKKLDPMNEIVDAMRANREKALGDPTAPRRFSGENLIQVEFISSSQPWQALEDVFQLDWAAVNTESASELTQLKKALKVKTVLDHPDIKIIELALGPGALLPRHADAAPGAFHIIEGAAEITVDGKTIQAYTLGSRMRETLDERRSQLGTDRVARLARVQQQVEKLKKRGLLKKQRCVVVTTSDFEKKFYS